MLLIVVAVLAVLWLIGLLADLAGNAIHLLLIIAAAVLIYQLVTGRRAA